MSEIKTVADMTDLMTDTPDASAPVSDNPDKPERVEYVYSGRRFPDGSLYIVERRDDVYCFVWRGYEMATALKLYPHGVWGRGWYDGRSRVPFVISNGDVTSSRGAQEDSRL